MAFLLLNSITAVQESDTTGVEQGSTARYINKFPCFVFTGKFINSNRVTTW